MRKRQVIHKASTPYPLKERVCGFCLTREGVVPTEITAGEGDMWIRLEGYSCRECMPAIYSTFMHMLAAKINPEWVGITWRGLGDNP